MRRKSDKKEEKEAEGELRMSVSLHIFTTLGLKKKYTVVNQLLPRFHLFYNILIQKCIHLKRKSTKMSGRSSMST